jgi:hypothetical protein
MPRIELSIMWSCIAFVSGVVGVHDAAMVRQMINEWDDSFIDPKTV